MKLCDYGCGYEAKYYFKNVNKFCCSSHYKKCPNQRKLVSGNKNPFYGKNHNDDFKIKHSIRMKKYMSNPINNPMKNIETIKKVTGRKHSNQTKNKIREAVTGKNNPMYGKRRTISYIRGNYLLFSKIEEMRYNPDKLGEKEIQVHCKNHNCPNSKEQGGWFTPTGRQLECRIWALESENGNEGSYFYCCDECKNECPLYNLKSDPFKDNSKNYTQEEYQQFREFVLERDDYICQYCGEKAEHVHHERPQKIEPFFSLDPDYAISVCSECHYKYCHKDECSTGSLANKICI